MYMLPMYGEIKINCSLSELLRVLQTGMALWHIDSSSCRESPISLYSSDTTKRRDSAVVGFERSVNVSTPPSAVQVPPGPDGDDSLPSPSTPLRQRRLPASFWQEPNVPRRPVRRAWWRRGGGGGGTAGRATTPQTSVPQPSPDEATRPGYTTAATALSSWRGSQTRVWKDGGFNFDVSAKPQSASLAAADLVRHFPHLSPWSTVVPGYPLLAADYAGGPADPPEELASSAAVAAAYLRWRAAEECGCYPASNSLSVADWTSMMWRQCAPAATAIDRFHRYRPYWHCQNEPFRRLLLEKSPTNQLAATQVADWSTRAVVNSSTAICLNHEKTTLYFTLNLNLTLTCRLLKVFGCVIYRRSHLQRLVIASGAGTNLKVGDGKCFWSCPSTLFWLKKYN